MLHSLGKDGEPLLIHVIVLGFVKVVTKEKLR